MTSQSQIVGRAQSGTPAVVPEGSLWYDTSNDVLKASDGTTYNQIGRTSFSNSAVVSHSTTSTDYTLPNRSKQGSTWAVFDRFDSYADTTAGDASYPTSDTTNLRVNPTNDVIDWIVKRDSSNDAMVYDLGSGNVSETAWTLRMKIVIASFTEGADNSTFWGISDSVQTTSSTGNQDMLGLAFRGTGTAHGYGCFDTEAAAPTSATVEDEKSDLVFAAGTYYLQIRRLSAIAYDVKFFSNASYSTQIGTTSTGVCTAACNALRYIKLMNRVAASAGAGAITATIDNITFYDGVTSSTECFSIDGDTATDETTAAGVNKTITYDMGSALNLCAVALYHDGTNNTETAFKIQTSIDDSTYTDKRTITVSNLTNNSYNYYRFNIAGGARYVRVYGNSGSSLVLSVTEFRVLKKTDAEIFADLGIVNISASDTALDGDGV